MGKKLLIDATHAEETRVVVLDGTKVEDFDFETIHKRQLAGNIYLAKVTRVEPSLQAAFVDYGGNRHGFLAFAEIHPDYYQIPVEDRKALLAEERAMARAEEDGEGRESGRENGGRESRRNRRRGGRGEDRPQDGTDAGVEAGAAFDDAGTTRSEDAGLAPRRVASGMDIVDLDEAEAEGEAGAGDGAPAQTAAPTSERRGNGEDEPEPYRAADHASDLDDQIETVADEDVSDEVRTARRPRARRYKIQEVIKVRQIMLVQVVKEERGNKGAALTTYLSLAGRYCVLMPNTARGGGISRKITNPADRKKLKEIAGELEVPEGAGLIVRTAGANRSKPEIKRDYEYLFRLWEQIRDLTLKSVAPAPIYEEGDLIKRAIRDLHSPEIDEVLVEGEAGFRAARDFMRMIMPTQVAQVKLYTDPMPLFARHQVESYLAGMFNPVVQLKSGGYIVIGVTEALVAIDINSGKSTREGSIEDTALKTNLEAADEIARQLRLRDLAGLIVIDFIDMEERRNNAAVEKRLKDALRTDRARIQVGRISGFGLLEMSRQRLRPGMLEATTQACPHCHGTGLIRSDNSIALAILRALEEEGVRNRSREVLVKAPIGVVNWLFNQKREHLAQIETRYGMAVRIEADPSLVSPDYALEKFKTATRVVRPASPVVSLDAQTMSGVDEALAADAILTEPEVADAASMPVPAPAAARPEGAEAGDGGRKKRRRRRRRRGGEARTEENGATDSFEDEGDEGDEVTTPEAPVAADPAPAEATPAEPVSASGQDSDTAPETAGDTATDEAKPKRRRRTRSEPATGDEPKPAAPAPDPEAAAPAAPEQVPAKARRSRRKPAAAAEAPGTVEAAPELSLEPEPAAPQTPEPEVAAVAPQTPANTFEAVAEASPASAPVDGAAMEAAPADANRPRRSGWWASRRG
jgi:ribonuclease E